MTGSGVLRSAGRTEDGGIFFLFLADDSMGAGEGVVFFFSSLTWGTEGDVFLFFSC